MNKKFFVKAGLLVVLLSFGLMPVMAQSSATSVEHKVPVEVVKVISEQAQGEGVDKTLLQVLQVRFNEGILRGKLKEVENNNNFAPGIRKYGIGDQVFLVNLKSEDGKSDYQVYDYNRLNPIWILLIMFIVLTVVIGRWQGIAAFLGMIFSFMIIFFLVLPRILAGDNAFFIAIVASLLIVPITFYLAHGFNKKSNAAIIGTMITLLIVGVISTIAVDVCHITGGDSEDVSTLMLNGAAAINIKDLLLAGIIISLLGILDDIAISQAAIVFKLKEVSPELKFGGLFRKSMDVGRDHIASVVNTLVLVYAGAALPLLLIFLKNPAPVSEIINEGFMAEEIIRTLIASMGIVIAVPLTTFVAALMIEKWGVGEVKKGLRAHHEHVH